MLAPLRAVRRHRTVATAVPVAALLGLGIAAAPGSAQDSGTAPAIVNAGSPQAIQGSYLVVLEGPGGAPELAAEYGVRVLESYGSALDGVLVEADEATAERLAADPAVRLVEQNTRVRAMSSGTITQPDPPSCGLDRIDQPALPLDNSFTYPESSASGVTVYVVDTGIHYAHPDLHPRAVPGFDAGGGDGGDENGHGTHVAGLIGGTEHGAAKASTLVSVKVLDAGGSGTIADVVAGIDWISGHATGPSVANVSIGGAISQVLDEAVRDSIRSGVTYSVAAGGSAAHVDGFSPARVDEAIVVGAAGCADQVAAFSNYGGDLYAPGVGITSTWPDGTTRTLSGTSAAAGYTAGVAALYLGQRPAATPAEVAQALDDAAVRDQLTGPAVPNKLLQVAYADPAPTG